jgi:hypothetical protein
MASDPTLVWADFDQLIAGADTAAPWVGGKADPVYEPDYGLLEKLLAVPLRHGSSTQSGLPAKAIDVWMAHELRRAGFPRDEVWPRATPPRVLPRDVGMLRRAPGTIMASKNLFKRIDTGEAVKGITSADAKVLGRAYEKQVDVVMAQWARGPEILISTKRMDSSFGNNAANRIEESYGDAKNLRGRHPLAALGFLFVIRSTAFETKRAVALKFVDLLAKLAEPDGYDATGLIVVEWEDPTGTKVTKEIDEDKSEQINVATRVLPWDDLPPGVPETLNPARFIKAVIEAVLDRTPVDLHQDARAARGQETPALSPARGDVPARPDSPTPDHAGLPEDDNGDSGADSAG